jgi:hypothetical protein
VLGLQAEVLLFSRLPKTGLAERTQTRVQGNAKEEKEMNE